jgi:hypothetical protein
MPIFGMWFSLLRDMVFAETLYHEIGPHLELTIGPLAQPGEATAEAWRKRLWRDYCTRQYWYSRSLARVAKWLVSRRFPPAAT